LVSQAAGLLVQLLSERHHLGLVVPGDRGPVLHPAARLSPEYRSKTLKEVARLRPAPGQVPLPDLLRQALGAFDPKEPTARALLLITDGARVSSLEKPTAPTPASGRQPAIIDQAQKAGVAVFAAVLGQAPQPDFIKNLTAATGGRFWDLKDPADLHVACLRLYECLELPQQVPISSARVLLDPWVKEAVLVATRSAPGKGVVLSDSRGARITSRSRAKTIQWTACEAFDLIILSQPRPGIWRLAQAREEASRVFLDTDLKLLAPKAPREVGEDEALQIAAMLQLDQKTPVGSDLLKDANLTAELTVGGLPPRKADLKPPGTEVPSLWPPGGLGRGISPLTTLRRGDLTIFSPG